MKEKYKKKYILKDAQNSVILLGELENCEQFKLNLTGNITQ